MEDLDAQEQVPSSSDATDIPASSGANAAAASDDDTESLSESLVEFAELLERDLLNSSNN
jgi:hypothetical protein